MLPSILSLIAANEPLVSVCPPLASMTILIRSTSGSTTSIRSGSINPACLLMDCLRVSGVLTYLPLPRKKPGADAAMNILFIMSRLLSWSLSVRSEKDLSDTTLISESSMCFVALSLTAESLATCSSSFFINGTSAILAASSAVAGKKASTSSTIPVPPNFWNRSDWNSSIIMTGKPSFSRLT